MRLLASIILFMTGAASACTIPVFRYALDRWDADRFHLVLPPSVARDALVAEMLRPLRANGKANLDIETSKDPALLRAELRFSTRDQETFWSGVLDQASLNQLIDSPARRKITEHILAGDSIIWVMADHGTPEDEAQAQHLEKRLKFLEQVATLPIQNPNDPDSQLGPGPPLKLKFTLLRFRSDDPAESAFVKMLAGPTGHIDPAQTSYAAVVFGRGRVLGAWPLEDLNDAALEDASMFLVGRCSCRIKNENPGWDILMDVDWEKSLLAATGKETSSLPPAIPQTTSLINVVEVIAKPNAITAGSSPKVETAVTKLAVPKPMTSTLDSPLDSPRSKIAMAGVISAVIGLVWLVMTFFRRKSHS